MNPTTHASKAKYYELGRAEYPLEFFDYLYGELGIKPTDVIADIGCGTGKVAKHFLERGNTVYGIEYDADMLNIAKSNLGKYPNFILVNTSAENTQIGAGIIDVVFCGNSYCWFNREIAVPEFKRICKNGAYVLIAYLGGDSKTNFSEDLNKVHDKYRQFVLSKTANTLPPFAHGKFNECVYKFTAQEDKQRIVNASLSQSSAPAEDSDMFKPFCDEVSEVFEKHAVGGFVEAQLKLRCDIGKAEDLM